MIDKVNPPDQLRELPERTRAFLAGLRPDEVETLKVLVEMPAKDVEEGFKLIRDMKAVGRFTRWLVLTVVSLFIGTMLLYENILKALRYMRGPTL